MLKKIAAILFLLLTVLILAQAVMPHHHHDGLICIESSHCDDDTDSHEQSSETNDHRHDGSSDVHSCILKQAIPNQTNHTQKICKCINCKTAFPTLIFAVLFPEIKEISFIKKNFLYTPFKQSDYSVFASKCSGLRAPPTV